MTARTRPAVRRMHQTRHSLKRHTPRASLDGLREGVATAADAVLGAEEQEALDRRAGARFAAVFAAVALLLVLRRPDAVLNPQFWAEDGVIYFRQNLVLGFWGSLAELYTGFPYLLHRLIAQAARPFGLAQAPLVFSASALLTASACLSLVSLPHFRHLVGDDRLRALLALALAALPDVHEVLGTVANLQWYLGIGAVFLSLMRLPRTRWGLALALLAYLVCVFSSPVAIITAPFWLLRLLRAIAQRPTRARLAAVLCAALALGVFLAVALVSTPNLGANPAMRFDPTAFWNIVVGRVTTQALLGTPATLRLGRDYGFPAFYQLTVAAAVVLVGLTVAARFRNVPALLVCGYVLLASIAITLLGRSEWNDYAREVATLFPPAKGRWHIGAGRYFVIGLAMVYLAAFATVDRLRAGLPRAAATVALLAGLVAVLAPTFRISPLPDRQWAQYAARLEAKAATGSREPLIIPINPDGWAIPLDAVTLLPAAGVPAEALTVELTGDREIAQTFVSDCAHLSRVDLRLATYGRTNRQPVELRLYDTTTGIPVAGRTLAGPAVADNAWQELRFSPLHDSHGKRYRLVLRSPASRPGDAISVWRSAGDAYPSGEAFVDGEPVRADLVFRYWCGL